MGRFKIGDIALRILSVIIAVFLWIVAMNVNNPSVQPVQIKGIPVKFVNMDVLTQRNLVFSGNPDGFTANLYVEGRENSIKALQAKPGSIVLEADMASGANYLRKGMCLIHFEIKSQPKDIDIQTNQIQSIEVELDQIESKTFTVDLNIEHPKKTGYAAQDAVINPKEVTVKGPSKILGNVRSVVAQLDASNATASITKSLQLQLKDNAGNVIPDKSLACSPSNVDVTVPIKRAKDVPIVVRKIGNLPDGVTLKEDPVPSPGKISITGDDSVVGGISFIETTPINLNEITQSMTKNVRIVLPAGATVVGNVQTVTVNIEVERTTTKSFSVPVTAVNLPDGLKAEVVTNNINVTLSGQESALNNLDQSSISAVVDLSSAQAEDGEFQFTPKVTPPPGFNMVSFEPAKVKVKITRKQG